MFQSTEVRWFSEKPHSDIVDWFELKGVSFERTNPRTDFYQELESEELGIKLREGKVETKKRIRQLGLHEFSDDVHGTIEIWNKWSFGIEKSDIEATNIIHNGLTGWTAVRKERIGVKAIFKNGWEYLPMSEFPENGIQIEYTRITVQERVLYTFCLEAFGIEQPDIKTYPLQKIVGKSVLLGQDSYSYPKLLWDLL
jgi:hypothetical protein